MTINGDRTVPGGNGRQFSSAAGIPQDLLGPGIPLTEPDVAQDLPFKLVGSRLLSWI